MHTGGGVVVSGDTGLGYDESRGHSIVVVGVMLMLMLVRVVIVFLSASDAIPDGIANEDEEEEPVPVVGRVVRVVIVIVVVGEGDWVLVDNRALVARGLVHGGISSGISAHDQNRSRKIFLKHLDNIINIQT